MLLPLLTRAVDTLQIEAGEGRLELPARLAVADLRVRSADGSVAIRAAQARLAVDLWASWHAGHWVVDELTADGLDVTLHERAEQATQASSFDPFRVDLRRVELHDTRLEHAAVNGARTILGPAALVLQGHVPGGAPSVRLKARVQLIGSDRSEHGGDLDLALTGTRAADVPQLAWEGTLQVLLRVAGLGDNPDSAFDLAGELRGELEGARLMGVTAQLFVRQAGLEAGRVQVAFRHAAPSDAPGGTAQTAATLTFSDVPASLLNPLLASAGLNPLDSGLLAGDLKWDAARGTETISSSVDARDLRVRHAGHLLGPFVLHSRQAATWDTRTRELAVEQFELDVVLAGASRIRGRLDRPLTLFGAPSASAAASRQHERAKAEIVVDGLPLRELGALRIPVAERLWTSTLTGRAVLEALGEGSGAYALDFTLALPRPKRAPKGARSVTQAQLEIAGRAARDRTIEVERAQLGLRSGRSTLLALNGTGRYALAARRLELAGAVESGKLATLDFRAWLPAAWTHELRVDAIRGSWSLAVDTEQWTLRADPELRTLAGGPASRPTVWRPGDVALALALEAQHEAPLQIRELRVRAPALGRDAELRARGVADLRAARPTVELGVGWRAISVAALPATGLVPAAAGVDRLTAGVLEGDAELTGELEGPARIRGTARLDAAEVKLGQRALGPIGSTAVFTLSTERGRPSALTSDVTCRTDRGTLLRVGLRWPAEPQRSSTYALNVGLLDLGRVRSLLGEETPPSGPVLTGDLRVSAEPDTVPFRFELQSVPPAGDRLSGTGTFSRTAKPTAGSRVQGKVRLERLTLDSYLELFDRVAGLPAEPGARPRGPDVEIEGEIGELSWRELTLQEGHFVWTRDRRGSSLVLRPERALGGSLTGWASLTTSAAGGSRLQWDLAGDSLQVEGLARTMRGPDADLMRGTLRIRTEGGLQLGAGPRQGTGRTALALTNGQFGNSGLLEFMAVQTRISALRRMRFDALSADLALAGDTLEVVAIDVRSPVAGLAMTGALDLSGKLDLRVATRVGPELRQLLSATEYSEIVGGTLDRFLTLPILVLVQGTLTAPTYSVRPTTASVTSTLWDTVSGAGRLLQRGTDSIFKKKP